METLQSHIMYQFQPTYPHAMPAGTLAPLPHTPTQLYVPRMPSDRLPSFSELMLSIAHEPAMEYVTMPRGRSPPLSRASMPLASDSEPTAISLPAQSLSDAELPLGSHSPGLPMLPESDHVLPSGLKRKHTCKTCGRLCTTLGHLARHNRIHTGERNHTCPFPQCLARFARQDNCMQHYKTHMNGKCKRTRSKTDA